jgi:uncharacterized BrkB/YihY/UPF0761 family membrane protein
VILAMATPTRSQRKLRRFPAVVFVGERKANGHAGMVDFPLKKQPADWSEHKDARLGAALAYHSIFSVGSRIVIAVAIAGLAFGAEAGQGKVI